MSSSMTSMSGMFGTFSTTLRRCVPKGDGERRPGVDPPPFVVDVVAVAVAIAVVAAVAVTADDDPAALVAADDADNGDGDGPVALVVAVAVAVVDADDDGDGDGTVALVVEGGDWLNEECDVVGVCASRSSLECELDRSRECARAGGCGGTRRVSALSSSPLWSCCGSCWCCSRAR